MNPGKSKADARQTSHKTIAYAQVRETSESIKKAANCVANGSQVTSGGQYGELVQ